MRVLLDVHVSPRHVAGPLRTRGHDVRAAGEDLALARLRDDALLAVAASEHRVLVTFNVRDFARLSRKWADAGRSHSGCMIVAGVDHREFRLVVRRIDEAFCRYPRADDWRNLTLVVTRDA